MNTEIQALFSYCHTPEERYKKIIELGKSLPQIDPSKKTEENLVRGCQSIVYLNSEIINEKIYFTASSDALISSGLAMLLILAYSEKPPEYILKNKPIFLEELGITGALSPSRSNGLASIYLRMQQDALKYLVLIEKNF